MKHIIIGTAGHIDHGKTTLIKALTGRSTDRLKEEKERGISIELGFTYFDLPNGQRAGIIDVPGHEKFIKNMLAGIVGIDIVILVVAADEGFMPQTREHLDILDLLGIENGIVALSKCDLVEDEWIDLVEEEIKEEVKDTFLEGSPIIRISSKDKQGVEELINNINIFSQNIEEKNIRELPRLPIDRAFTISGFGTIVAGTLLSGSLTIGKEVRLYPKETIGRIRSIQVHGDDVEEAFAGQRVAINLAGVDKDDVEVGLVAAPDGSMETTMMLDVKVRLLKSMDRNISNRTRIRLYIGSKEVLARIVLLDREELRPGEEAYAQLRLEEEIVAKMKDKFIIRFYSPMYTIGGGIVLDSNPIKAKRFDENLIRELEIKEKGSQEDIIENIIRDNKHKFVSTSELLSSISALKEEVIGSIENLEINGKIYSLELSNEVYYIHHDTFIELKENIIKELKNYHEKYPLRPGMLKEEIRSRYLSDVLPRVGELFINKLDEYGYISQDNQFVKLITHEVEYDELERENVNNIIKYMDNEQFLLKGKEEIKGYIEMDEFQFNEIFNSLVQGGEIIKLNEEIYITREKYKEAVEILTGYLEEKNEITVAEFRDLINTNRKVSIALLEYLDQQRVTKRQENIRTLYKG